MMRCAYKAKDVRAGEKLADGPLTLQELVALNTDAAAWAIWRRMETKRIADGGETHGYTGRNSKR